jgi:hypothetical protein
MSPISRRLGSRREDVGAARQILLDQIILRRALQLAAIGPLLVGQRHVHRQQPGGRGVDGHGGVHLLQRDLAEERAHVAQVADRHPDLADLAARQDVVGVVAGLGGQVEGHRQARLAPGQIGPIQRVGLLRRRVAGIGAEDPRRIRRVLVRLGHDALPGLFILDYQRS